MARILIVPPASVDYQLTGDGGADSELSFGSIEIPVDELVVGQWYEATALFAIDSQNGSDTWRFRCRWETAEKVAGAAAGTGTVLGDSTAQDAAADVLMHVLVQFRLRSATKLDSWSFFTTDSTPVETGVHNQTVVTTAPVFLSFTGISSSSHADQQASIRVARLSITMK